MRLKYDRLAVIQRTWNPLATRVIGLRLLRGGVHGYQDSFVTASNRILLLAWRNRAPIISLLSAVASGRHCFYRPNRCFR